MLSTSAEHFVLSIFVLSFFLINLHIYVCFVFTVHTDYGTSASHSDFLPVLGELEGFMCSSLTIS